MKPTRLLFGFLLLVLVWTTTATALVYNHYPRLEPRYSRGTFYMRTAGGGGNYHDFIFNVPPNTACLAIRTGQDGEHGWGECHLYARFNRAPNLASYYRRARGAGHRKTIIIDNPAVGRWYIRVWAPAAGSLDSRMRTGLTITAIPWATTGNATWRRQMLSYVNRTRQSYGRPTVAWNHRLNNAAQMQAEQMVFRNFCSTRGVQLGFQHLNQRILAAGYNAQNQYELNNCATADALQIVNAWMANPTQRNQLLDHRLRDVGFGQLAPRRGPRASVGVFANPR